MQKILSGILAIILAAGFAATVSALEPVDYTPPANLDTLSEAEQLAYFNLVINRVRTERPEFKRRTLFEIGNIQLTGSASIANPIIQQVKDSLMPGDWVYSTVGAGQTNEFSFFSPGANASSLRLEDITAITAKKQENNWVIELAVKEEINPMPGLESAHGRMAEVATREQVIDEITTVSNAISAEPSDATMQYYHGFASVTVNSQGRVIVAAHGYQVRMQANNVKFSILRTDVTAAQNTQWQYACFGWADEEPFPPAMEFSADGPSKSPDVPFQWWQRLPCQWFFRWFLFGWIWMR